MPPCPRDGLPRLPDSGERAVRSARLYSADPKTQISSPDLAKTAPHAIYHLGSDGGWQIGDGGFVVCNGPAFSARGDVYFNDTIGRRTRKSMVERSSHLCRCGRTRRA